MNSDYGLSTSSVSIVWRSKISFKVSLSTHYPRNRQRQRNETNFWRESRSSLLASPAAILLESWDKSVEIFLEFKKNVISSSLLSASEWPGRSWIRKENTFPWNYKFLSEGSHFRNITWSAWSIWFFSSRHTNPQVSMWRFFYKGVVLENIVFVADLNSIHFWNQVVGRGRVFHNSFACCQLCTIYQGKSFTSRQCKVSQNYCWRRGSVTQIST